MEITVIPPDLSHADCWVVTVEGHGSDRTTKSEAVAYCGKNADIAKRTLIEALALASLFPGGRRPFSNVFDYSYILTPAVSKSNPDSPFFWAARRWSQDPSSDHDRDATIDSAKISFIDSYGRTLPTETSLSEEEMSFIGNTANLWIKSADRVRRRFDAPALVAGIQELFIGQSIPAARIKKTPNKSC